ncbi:hypothetical protein jhhlp_006838 [Lomentospora prolificans]|uniref:Uncharacterized protein n=1 Tax=Lomentospora prolificans TaxID=41688 RepID=A0A2N3N2X1_9PEZI|nr:hypothetical protein jhhlp_006838 [Lomentospora prolificans]
MDESNRTFLECANQLSSEYTDDLPDAMSDRRDQAYDADPPIPTYDEAVAGGTFWSHDEQNGRETESQSLLPSHSNAGPSRRHPAGYRPPTVETDDEESEWTSEDDEETTQVRREIHEMEIEEDERSRSSIFGKRMPFSLTLPKWRWSWRFRIPRPQIRLPSRVEATSGEAESGEEEGTTSRRWRLPNLDPSVVLLFVARILALFVVLGFFYIIFISDVLTGVATRVGGGIRPSIEDLSIFLHNHLDEAHMRASVKHFTNYAHLAGTEGDYALAEDVREMFIRAGLEDILMDRYHVYLNYPKPGGRAVEILGDDSKPVFSAKLEEEDLGETTAGRQTLAFHAHSKSGDVQGPLIYANYGSREDFAKLNEAGITTTGAIALVKYAGTQKDLSLKIKAAELAGFIGCIVYNDPADNGFKLGDVAPHGRFMPADAVPRGSVSSSRWVIGDVLTPGLPSTEEVHRSEKKDATALPGIPSIPLSSRDAGPLLKAIKGFGQPTWHEWVGGVPDIGDWWTGNLSSPIVRLKNEQDEIEKQPVWNVYGKITGIEQNEKSIIIGNHRDSLALGATNPHSGTSVLIELARVLGDLRSRGWIPLRTIEFMSWDGAEYNLIGSTEYVEANEGELRRNAWAYINLDRAVVGSEFHASGSPAFNRLLLRILDRLWDPAFNTTLRDVWNNRNGVLENLDCTSDYLPFQTIAGTSSIDLSFQGEGFPEFTSYDNFEWVEAFGDPGFTYHRMMAEIVGLMVIELSDRYIMPFDLEHYANKLGTYVTELEIWAKGIAANSPGDKKPELVLTPLTEAVKLIKSNAKDFALWEMEWDATVLGGGGWESTFMNSKRRDYNDRMSRFETALLDQVGIPGRNQFKHAVFGPSRWDDTTKSQFPSIRSLIEDGKWTEANVLVGQTAGILIRAAEQLKLP